MTDLDRLTERGLLVLPRLRIQNANAISSPMTWGFPGMTHFAGLMTALARKLGPQAGLAFSGFGVICHGFDPQTAHQGYTRTFRLTRNPVLQDGSTAAIVEEGRAHLDISLVFAVSLGAESIDEASRRRLARQVGQRVSEMRVAGGSVVPRTDLTPERQQPYLWLMPPGAEDAHKALRRLVRRWLPGYALVCRDDLLHGHWAQLKQADPQASLFDAWLSLSRWTHRAVRQQTLDDRHGEPRTHVEWVREKRDGWIVPIPVGYAGLSALYPPGAVSGARDARTPFRFVESVYSIGQWISPHRLRSIEELLWFTDYDDASGVYRCINQYPAAPAAAV